MNRSPCRDCEYEFQSKLSFKKCIDCKLKYEWDDKINNENVVAPLYQDIPPHFPVHIDYD